MNEYSFILWQNRGVTAQPTAAAGRRTAIREKRRRELIDATMKCIARKGMSATTLGDVAKEAGLSAGIVNLHFDSKENLLNETLEELANEYRGRFDRTLEKSAPDPAEQLRAVMELDFKPRICNPRKLAVWFAYWGEATAQPAYRKVCDEFDRYYDDVVRALCARIIAEGHYPGVSAKTVANALTSMTNGLWLSCLISPKSWDRHEAMTAVMSYLENIFPRHYGRD